MLRLFVLENHPPNTIPRVLMRPRKGSNMGGKTWLRGEGIDRLQLWERIRPKIMTSKSIFLN
jgi:hypothetical protein